MCSKIGGRWSVIGSQCRSKEWAKRLLLTAHSTLLAFMGWMIIITLLIFYALGVAVFHATSVQVLPGIALVILIADRWLVWKYAKPDVASPQG